MEACFNVYTALVHTCMQDIITSCRCLHSPQPSAKYNSQSLDIISVKCPIMHLNCGTQCLRENVPIVATLSHTNRFTLVHNSDWRETCKRSRINTLL